MFHPLGRSSQTDLSRTVNSGMVRESRSERTPPPCVRAVKVISRMRGGAQSRLMLCDDRNLWIVKFKNNPQHLRVLANELMATQIAGAIGLPVPVSGIIDVSQSLIEENPQLYIDQGSKGRELCSSGLQFGSQFAGGMISRQIVEYLAEEQLLTPAIWSSLRVSWRSINGLEMMTAAKSFIGAMNQNVAIAPYSSIKGLVSIWESGPFVTPPSKVCLPRMEPILR